MRSLRSFVRRVAVEAGCDASEVTVVLTGDEEVRSLNRRYRGLDRTTDVLSFPGETMPGGGRCQGDIVISVDKARRQAAQRHHDLATEIHYLVIHGFLHLMGYDHEGDDGEMEAEERRLRRCLMKTRRGA